MTFLVVLLTSLFVLIINLVNPLLLLEAKMLLIKAILKEDQYCRKVRKKHLNKNLTCVKKKNYFNREAFVGYAKISLIMMMKR